MNWANNETGLKTATIPILGDSLAEGTETVNLSLTGASGALLGQLSTARLAILDPPRAAWQAATFGPAAANTAPAQPAADFEGDTVTNLVEYGLSGNALAADLPWLAGRVAQDGDDITFDFPRNLAATDINWRILGAEELQPGTGGWSEIAAKIGAAPWSTIPGATISEDPVTGLVRLTLEADTQLYLKLEVTQ